MNHAELCKFLAGFPEAVEDRPFGPETLVFKVATKMFALVGEADGMVRVSLKCDPELSTHLRSTYAAVQPGYYMNKLHWNTVTLDGTVPDVELRAMIEHSYERVVAGLSKVERARLLMARKNQVQGRSGRQRGKKG